MLYAEIKGLAVSDCIQSHNEKDKKKDHLITRPSST